MTNEELLAAIDARFSAFAEQIDARFEQIDARFEQIDERLGRVEARLDVVETEVRHGLVQIEDLRVKIETVAEGVTGFDRKLVAFQIETRQGFEGMQSLNAAVLANIQNRMNIYDQRLGLS